MSARSSHQSVDPRESSGPLTQLTHAQNASNLRQQIVTNEYEDAIRIRAMKELQEEGANRFRIVYDKQTQTRMLEEKRATEQIWH
jgi:hypothetical protein